KPDKNVQPTLQVIFPWAGHSCPAFVFPNKEPAYGRFVLAQLFRRGLRGGAGRLPTIVCMRRRCWPLLSVLRWHSVVGHYNFEVYSVGPDGEVLKGEHLFTVLSQEE